MPRKVCATQYIILTDLLEDSCSPEDGASHLEVNISIHIDIVTFVVGLELGRLVSGAEKTVVTRH